MVEPRMSLTEEIPLAWMNLLKKRLCRDISLVVSDMIVSKLLFESWRIAARLVSSCESSMVLLQSPQMIMSDDI